jgi:hypothetical protein
MQHRATVRFDPVYQPPFTNGRWQTLSVFATTNAMRRRTAVSVPLLVSGIGCASPLRLPNIDADAALAVGSGLLVTRVLLTDEVPGFTQRPEVQITLIDEKNLLIASAILPLTPGENFRVIALPTGSYTWRGIYLGTYSAEFRGRLPFKIAAGTAC